MAETIREKVERALGVFVADRARGDRVELEDVPPNKVGGVVISSRFEGMPLSERQDEIWRELDKALTPLERTQVVLILADTPEEYRILKESA